MDNKLSIITEHSVGVINDVYSYTYILFVGSVKKKKKIKSENFCKLYFIIQKK